MKIAIMGMGVVGRGVYDIITRYFSPDITVKYILDLLPLPEIRALTLPSDVRTGMVMWPLPLTVEEKSSQATFST